jgi:membrane fusion protein, copper/silver efflux system
MSDGHGRRPGGARRLITPVLLAAALAAGVVLVRHWRSSSPTGASIDVQAGPFRVAARFAPDPPRPGRNDVTLTVLDAAGVPVEGVSLRATATMPAMGSMPAMQRVGDATALGGGRYRLTLELPMAGSWPLGVDLRAADGRAASVTFDYTTGVPVRAAETAAGADGGEAAGAAGETAAGSAPGAGAATGAGGDAIAYYSCSMHPSVRSATPGTCPICGMDLVPVTQRDLETGVVRVDATRRQLIGVTTGRVERKPLVAELRAVGQVSYDETRLTDVSMKYRGWVGTVAADYTGVQVKKGEPLFTLYSPELLSAQEELLESMRRAGGGGQRESTLAANARRRLRLWDLSDGQIAELVARGRAAEYMPMLSPVTGTVIEKRVVAGSAVEPGMRLYRIADLSTVWVEADVYESDLPLLAAGTPARVTLAYLPGRSFTGTITYVYPYLDPKTRTGRVRLEVPNPDGALKPAMYADVDLEIALGEQLVVPEEAVIRSGKTDLVFLDLGEGRLKPRTITLGRKGRDGYAVLDGLAAGDVVVTSGNFLIAAESKLKSGINQW